MTITSAHGDITKLQRAYLRLIQFFDDLKESAPQLNPNECWRRILNKAMEKFCVNISPEKQDKLPLPT